MFYSIVAGFFFLIIAVVVPFPVLTAAENDPVETLVERPVEQAIDIRQETQKAEEQWRQEREKSIALLEKLESEHDRLTAQRNTLREEEQGFQRRIEAKARQLAEIEKISQQIEPYLKKVLQKLNDLFTTDMPFLTAERRKRIDRVQSILDEPGTDVSEKFRMVMEALMVEAEYGRTIEVYQETIEVDERPVLVDIFRLGRMALFYRTLDHDTCGFYNIAEKEWRRLPASHNHAVHAAMEIGNKRRPVELLTLPVGRIQTP